MSSSARPDPIDLEAQYNNRAAVPEHPQIFARWQEQSAAFRRRADGRLDLAYGPGECEQIDVFPCRRAGSALHLFIHGGYWQALDKDSFSYLAEGLVGAGVTVAVVRYPLCPAVSLDALVDSLRRACIWLWEHAREFGADPGRFQVSGHSAGGHLTAMLMATDWPSIGDHLPRDLVTSGVAISGLFDLEPLRHTSINRALHLDARSALRNSPVALRPAAQAPLCVAVGGAESAEYHRQARDFAAAWRRHGVPIEVLELAGLNHFTILDQLANADGILLAAALRLLGETKAGG